MTLAQFAEVYFICGTTYGLIMLIFEEQVRIEFFGKGYKRTFGDWFSGVLAWATVSYFMWWWLMPLELADLIKKNRRK